MSSDRDPVMLSARARRATLLRLLASLGVPAATLAMANCGGIAVLDDGSGGAASSASSSSQASSTSASSSSGGFNCVVAPPPGSELVYGCMPSSAAGCLPASDYQVYELFWNAFAKECTDASSCWCFGDPCGCYIQPVDVPCGPGEVDGECCYYALMQPETGICEGRPFVVAGHVTLAAACTRADWCHQERLQSFGAAHALFRERGSRELNAVERQALAQHWQQVALNEHASVASFAQFVLELLALGAPPALLHEAQQACGDEIRHAESCFMLASRYAIEPLGPGAMPAIGALAARTRLRDVALAVAVEGCVNETVAALCAQASLPGVADEDVRVVLQGIVDDELRHAELAWRFLAWSCDQQPSLRAELADTLELSAAQLLRRAEQDLAQASAPAAEPSAALAAHGMASRQDRARAMLAAVREVVLPCAGALRGPQNVRARPVIQSARA